MFDNCTETVSILHAAIFGADDACIMLSTSSILTAFGAFMVFVIIAQFIARRVWKKLTQPRARRVDDAFDTDHDHPFSDDPNYSDSAIRSSKR